MLAATFFGTSYKSAPVATVAAASYNSMICRCSCGTPARAGAPSQTSQLALLDRPDGLLLLAPRPKALDSDRLLSELVDAASLLETAELLLLLSVLLPKENVDTPLDRSDRLFNWTGTSYWLQPLSVTVWMTAADDDANVRFGSSIPSAVLGRGKSYVSVAGRGTS